MASIRVPLLSRRARWAGVVLAALSIFVFSVVFAPPALPEPPDGFDLIPTDKWLHFLAYAILAASLVYALADRALPGSRLFLSVLLACAAYGFAIELIQGTLPARHFDFEDAYANTLGALVVLPWLAARRHVTVYSIVGDDPGRLSR